MGISLKGGVVMMTVRLVAVLIFTALLTGCDQVKSIEQDVKALKADIKALRVFLMSQPSPRDCRPPGMHEYSTTCYYKLEITDDKDKARGRYQGKIAHEVYEKSVKDCADAKQHLRDEFKDLPYECESNADQYPDTNVIYTFKVDGTQVLDKGKVYEFDSIPDTKLLAKRP
jgi:hypothetical protein